MVIATVIAMVTSAWVSARVGRLHHLVQLLQGDGVLRRTACTSATGRPLWSTGQEAGPGTQLDETSEAQRGWRLHKLSQRGCKTRRLVFRITIFRKIARLDDSEKVELIGDVTPQKGRKACHMKQPLHFANLLANYLLLPESMSGLGPPIDKAVNWSKHTPLLPQWFGPMLFQGLWGTKRS